MRGKPPLKIINLEAGMPTVPQALSRLAQELQMARGERVAALKIIHGYGSSGAGGALRLAIQADLAQRAARGEIRAFIAGEEWRVSNQAAWSLLQHDRRLRDDRDLGRPNRGISIVWL